MEPLLLLARTSLLIILFACQTHAQIIDRSQSPALPRQTYFTLQVKAMSSKNLLMINRGINMFCSNTCFEFILVSSKSDHRIGFTIKNWDSNLCTFDNSEGYPITVHVGGCAGPGEVAAIFFRISGLQAHEKRSDRDIRVGFLTSYGEVEKPLTPPRYNTYGSYDFNSILHSKPHRAKYTIIPKRHPKADPRRFPSAIQFEILTKRAMGQRTLPSITDITQINSELCGWPCRGNMNCGVGGYSNVLTQCRSCICPHYRNSFYCHPCNYSNCTDIAVKPLLRREVQINVAASRQPMYSIHTVTNSCVCPGYQPAIRFKFNSKETNVLMRDGSCQDYISIVTVDSIALPEEVRICGPIEKPINEFYIATTMDIYLRLVKDDWVDDNERPTKTIPLILDAVCLNLETGMVMPMLHWTYMCHLNSSHPSATIDKGLGDPELTTTNGWKLIEFNSSTTQHKSVSLTLLLQLVISLS